jgi:hypothetical protein
LKIGNKDNNVYFREVDLVYTGKGKGKSEVYPITEHEGPRGSSGMVLLFL